MALLDWLRTRHRRRTTPQPLVDFPAFQECPPDVLRELRRIDPTFEVVYFGQGEWWLGRVRWSYPRYLAGAKRARGAQQRDAGQHKHGLLAMQGFGYILSAYQSPSSHLVELARELHYDRLTGRMDEKWEQASFASDMERDEERRIRTVMDKHHAESGFIYRYAIRKRRHFTQGVTAC